MTDWTDSHHPSIGEIPPAIVEQRQAMIKALMKKHNVPKEKLQDFLWKMKKTLINWDQLEEGVTMTANTLRYNHRGEAVVRATRWTTKTIITQAVPHYLTEVPNILHAIALAKGQSHKGAMVCKKCRSVGLTNLATMTHLL